MGGGEDEIEKMRSRGKEERRKWGQGLGGDMDRKLERRAGREEK